MQELYKTDIPVCGGAPLEPATVVEAHAGLAAVVAPAGRPGRTWRVVDHADGVPVLAPGDRVLVLPLDGGAVITHRLRDPADRPNATFTVAEDGALVVKTEGTIRLQNGHATIELRADGRVFVEGREIWSLARGLQRLQGTTIELN